MKKGQCEECKEWGILSDMPTIPGGSLCIKYDNLLQQQVQDEHDWEEARGWIKHNPVTRRYERLNLSTGQYEPIPGAGVVSP
jgi:hypothetical protein